MVPGWLNAISWIWLALSFASAALIVIGEIKNPQKMWIMNVVWPLTALYFGPVAVWGYWRIGSRMSKRAMPSEKHQGTERRQPTWEATALSDTHCGAGCALGDIVGETIVFTKGLTLWGETLYADYAVTLLLAWAFGIVFQYFNIKPMKRLSSTQAIIESIKADTLSILAFQVGMYGWMALVYFVFFPSPHLHPNETAFWLMMQIGMILGFITSFPVNRWLLAKGIKEAMA
jgi:hypothetical protein